jgi:hypothetical protein
VVYVARQFGHDARLTLTMYGHVIDELPQVSEEDAIRAARHTSCVPGVSGEAADVARRLKRTKPALRATARPTGRWS